jgi:hypothetical protein
MTGGCLHDLGHHQQGGVLLHDRVSSRLTRLLRACCHAEPRVRLITSSALVRPIVVLEQKTRRTLEQKSRRNAIYHTPASFTPASFASLERACMPALERAWITCLLVHISGYSLRHSRISSHFTKCKRRGRGSGVRLEVVGCDLQASCPGRSFFGGAANIHTY